MKEKNKLERIIGNLRHGSIKIEKKMIVPSISFAMGYGLGRLGTYTNHHEIPAVPIAMDVFFGGVGKNHVIPYLAYGAGVAMNYLPEIYEVVQNIQNMN